MELQSNLIAPRETYSFPGIYPWRQPRIARKGDVERPAVVLGQVGHGCNAIDTAGHDGNKYRLCLSTSGCPTKLLPVDRRTACSAFPIG